MKNLLFKEKRYVDSVEYVRILYGYKKITFTRIIRSITATQKSNTTIPPLILSFFIETRFRYTLFCIAILAMDPSSAR